MGSLQRLSKHGTMATCTTVHQKSRLPCNVKPHKEPSAFAGTLQMLCGRRTACHGWRNIWWAELRRTERQLLNGRIFVGHLSADSWPTVGRLLVDSWSTLGRLSEVCWPAVDRDWKNDLNAMRNYTFVFDQLFCSSILELFSPNCNLVTGSSHDWLVSLNT